jgi:hypothetical protein
LTRKQVAQRLGLKEQQIQRHEAADYAAAKVERIEQVVRALGWKVGIDEAVGAERS